MCEISDPGMTEKHKDLNNLPLCRAVIRLDHIQNLARTDQVVASIGVRFVMSRAVVGIRVVVQEVLLYQNAQAMTKKT